MRRHRPGPQENSGDPDFSPRRPRGLPLGPTPEQRRRQRVAVAVIAVVVAAVMLGLWAAREPLGEHLAQGTERARLLDQAEQALGAGELSREDGRGARELYLAVLALDPDHQAARQGIADTGRAALTEAERAGMQGESARAEAMLQLARELHVPEHELARVQALQAQQGEDDEAELGNLLARIQATRRGHSAEEALPLLLPLYAQALELAPGHLLVLTSRSRLLGEVLDEAHRDIEGGDLDAAQAKIDRVAEVDAAHADLPGSRGRLSQARQDQAPRAPREATPAVVRSPPPPEADPAPGPVAAPGLPEAERDALLERFDEALARQALLDPPGDSAWDRLRVLRSGAPNDLLVIEAERRFRDSASACFEQHVVTPRLSAAENCLQALEAVDPGDARIGDASRRLAARWVGVAQERLGAAQFDAATRAYEAALARDPSHPELVALAARLELARPR
jgi:tetratricopeptide (TPR) repeat protein